MHGKPATLHLEALWRKNMTISTGQVDTFSTPWLLDLVTSGRLHVSQLVTHTFGLSRMEDAYEVFSRGTDTGAIKAMLHREQSRCREPRRGPAVSSRPVGPSSWALRPCCSLVGKWCHGSEPRVNHWMRRSGANPRTAQSGSARSGRPSAP
jgi:hypothetical protein